jgi:hypothetical protein
METDLIEHLRGIKGWKGKIGNTKISTVKEKETGKIYKYPPRLRRGGNI